MLKVSQAQKQALSPGGDVVEKCPASCPDVSFFEGSRTRAKYFGFDHKTNLARKKGVDEYWLPTPAHGTLSLPASRRKRDGARWVSVAVGKQTEVEIRFAFKGSESIPSIANCTYEVTPAGIATVVTKQITAKKAVFKIKGKTAGEASLKVMCCGDVIGWFHIWCRREATIKVDVVNLVTTRVSADALDLKALRAAFKDIFSQAVLKVDMLDLGEVDLSGDTDLATEESAWYSATGVLFEGLGFADIENVLNVLDAKASAALDARTSASLPRAGAYRIYRYVPAGGAEIAGSVINIGASPALSFMSDSADAHNSMAHEVGHSLGLRHPSDDESTGQYPKHLLSSRNRKTPAYAATNTEPATASADAEENVMARDPTNLMGYWDDKANRKPIRYLQWKNCSRS